jgi:hypothetical protein
MVFGVHLSARAVFRLDIRQPADSKLRVVGSSPIYRSNWKAIFKIEGCSQGDKFCYVPTYQKQF